VVGLDAYESAIFYICDPPSWTYRPRLVELDDTVSQRPIRAVLMDSALPSDPTARVLVHASSIWHGRFFDASNR